uniref:Uncharacterized protein n=1 Tax=Glossina palpalis gambiensis TaxID=67801 RepID=A0A1B0AMU7_9MUSC
MLSSRTNTIIAFSLQSDYVDGYNRRVLFSFNILFIYCLPLRYSLPVLFSYHLTTKVLRSETKSELWLAYLLPPHLANVISLEVSDLNDYSHGLVGFWVLLDLSW